MSKRGLASSIDGVLAGDTPNVVIDRVNKTAAIIGGGFGEDTRVDVINASGAHVTSVSSRNNCVALSTLPSGIYILRFADGDKIHTCEILL